MRYISCKLDDLKKIVLPIGYEGENEHTRVQVDAGEVFKEYPAAVPSLKVHGPGGTIYPAEVTRDGKNVIWDIKASDCAADGSGEAQFTFTLNNVIVKSCIAKIKVYRSIVGGSTPPDPVQDWLDEAQDVLDDLEAAEVHQPMIGVDGYWYTWNQETGEYEKTETKAQGEDGQQGPAGQDGAPGQDATPALITVNYSDLTFPVAEGTNCYHDGLLYYAKQAIQTSEAWTAAHWQQTTVEEQQRQLLNAIQGLDGDINGETTYTEETWTGELEKGRYDKNGNYTATNDYRSATIDMTNVVQMKVTATDAAGVDYALVVYLNSEDTVIGSAFDCDGTRKTYTQQVVENFPTGTAKAIVVHYRGTFDNPTIVLKKAQITEGLKDTVESMASDVETLDGQINGTTSQETVTWTGTTEHGRYDKNGNYTASNDYRSATVDMTDVVEMTVSATDAKSTDYAVVIFKNANGVVIGTALDCNGAERRTYENEVISNIPANTATAIVVNYRLYIDDPVIKLKKRVETAGIEEDVNDLKALTSDKFTMQGKKIVCFGDSIFGGKTVPNDIPSYLAKYLGATVYNCGFSGAWMADRQSQTGYNAFSLNHLIDSIVDDDFTEQENAFVITPDLPAQYRTNLTTLEGIDFSTVDIVTIALGTNDFMSAIPYENQNDDHDVTTVFGSLRHCIEELLTEFPNIRIFVLGQTYRFWMDGQGAFDYDSNTYERGDHTKLTDMVELTKDVAKEYNLPFIDNYKDLGICRYNRTQYFPANDGTHHNENGVILLARHIAHELY